MIHESCVSWWENYNLITCFLYWNVEVRTKHSLVISLWLKQLENLNFFLKPYNWKKLSIVVYSWLCYWWVVVGRHDSPSSSWKMLPFSSRKNYKWDYRSGDLAWSWDFVLLGAAIWSRTILVMVSQDLTTGGGARISLFVSSCVGWL